LPRIRLEKGPGKGRGWMVKEKETPKWRSGVITQKEPGVGAPFEAEEGGIGEEI